VQAVEILHPITDGTEAYEPGPVGKPTIVVNPSARLLELAEPGYLHLGQQIARFYDPEVTASELDDAQKGLKAESGPTLEQVREAAARYGMELMLKGSESQFAALAEELNLQLHIAQDRILELTNQLAEASGLMASAEPAEVDNAEMLASLSSAEAPEASAEGGDLAEAAAPLEDFPKSKRGK
jgi:hypothetical protein